MAESSLKFARILVIVDPTRLGQPALLRAEAIARMNHAEIVLYCCIDVDSDADRETAINLELAATRRWLERIALATRARGINVSIEVESNTQWRSALVEAAAKLRCDLVIKTASRHSLVGRLFTATADWMLLQSAASPVLLVSRTERRELSVRRLLAAIKLKPQDEDHEALNARILELAHYLARVADFELHAVTAFRGDEIFYDRQAFADSCRLPRNHVHSAEGAPQHAIAAVAAELGADTIVIGNPEDSETARRLIDHVDADVLVLPARVS